MVWEVLSAETLPERSQGNIPRKAEIFAVASSMLPMDDSENVSVCSGKLFAQGER
jgi:hypothetical protein